MLARDSEIRHPFSAELTREILPSLRESLVSHNDVDWRWCRRETTPHRVFFFKKKKNLQLGASGMCLSPVLMNVK